ncbi:MAG: hypothetical protein ABI042_08495 [Verrucomicrobiota bacterium]
MLDSRTLILSAVLACSSATAGLLPVGSQRQFFFDDSIIETTQNTMRRLNPAVKVSPNPIIKADKPWEHPVMWIAWVFFDQKLGKFRMRYTTGGAPTATRNAQGQIVENDGGAGNLCEAFSVDGIHWEKPSLGLVTFEGSTSNNIIPPEMHMAYFFQDLHDPDPARRYKAHVRKGEIDQPGMTFSYYYSADCYLWTAYEKNPTINNGEHVGRWGPTDFIGWDPIRKTYAVHMENNLHMNSAYKRRSIGRAESPDMITWSEPETIIVADNKDFPDTEFYTLPVAFHEGWYLGLLWNFSTANMTVVPHFVFSRDGVHYNRDYRQPVISLGSNGSFDSAVVYCDAPPIIHNGEILCFYTGSDWRSNEQLVSMEKGNAGIGLAKLPLDGFVSFDGARLEYSVVTTRSLTVAGDALYLSMKAAFKDVASEPCDVRVELLDGRLNPIKGYTFADSDVVSTTGSNQKISWKGNSSVKALTNKPLRVKFYFKNAKLFAFQFK